MDDGMKTVTWTLSMGLVGCKRTGTMEVDAEATPDEIDEIVQDHLMERVIQISWKEE
jgi:hypothetical protein